VSEPDQQSELQVEPTQTIVITGASRGIGAAIARRLANPKRTGSRRRLILLARSEDKLAELCDELQAKGAEAEHIKADLSTAELAAEAASTIADRCERIDALVLNAGMSNDAMFNDTTVADITYELGVNYIAPVTLLHSLMPLIEASGPEASGGHVVVVGSLTALVPYPSNATYSASKAALLALVRSLRVEMDGSGVHLGIVLPGATKTSLTEDKPSVIPSMGVDKVAKAVEKCIKGREGVVIPGLTNRLAATFFQEFPELSERLLKPLKKKIIPGFDGYHKS
jgi:short-subunit dehydrogenase